MTEEKWSRQGWKKVIEKWRGKLVNIYTSDGNMIHGRVTRINDYVVTLDIRGPKEIEANEPIRTGMVVLDYIISVLGMPDPMRRVK